MKLYAQYIILFADYPVSLIQTSQLLMETFFPYTQQLFSNNQNNSL